MAFPAFGEDVVRETDSESPSISVYVTGSNIPTVERETALPLRIITHDEIERTNLQTAAQLVERISATTSFSAFNESQGLKGGANAAGFAGGALRGLGYQFTVALLDGRRVAPYPFAPRGIDLNAIPLAAVDHVEVLADGASAVYGSDAIGGVINFILRKDYRGAEVFAQYTTPEHTGGYGKRLAGLAIPRRNGSTLTRSSQDLLQQEGWIAEGTAWCVPLATEDPVTQMMLLAGSTWELPFPATAYDFVDTRFDDHLGTLPSWYSTLSGLVAPPAAIFHSASAAWGGVAYFDPLTGRFIVDGGSGFDPSPIQGQVWEVEAANGPTSAVCAFNVVTNYDARYPRVNGEIAAHPFQPVLWSGCTPGIANKL